MLLSLKEIKLSTSGKSIKYSLPSKYIGFIIWCFSSPLIPKAIAFCVYGKEKRAKQEITQSGFQSCIMQGKDTCKSTFKYRKLDIFDKVMLY